MSTNPNIKDPSLPQTYYELLNIDPGASTSDIISAYHKAKTALAQNSVAAYSLISEKEKQSLLKELETAYLTLTNATNRQNYDRENGLGQDIPSNKNEAPPTLEASEPPQPKPAEPTRLPQVTGEALRAVRQQRSYTIEDVSKITKIPKRYLTAIEQEDFEKLPARVYLQGFIQNLSRLYQLDVTETPQAYLEHLRQVKPLK